MVKNVLVLPESEWPPELRRELESYAEKFWQVTRETKRQMQEQRGLRSFRGSYQGIADWPEKDRGRHRRQTERMVALLKKWSPDSSPEKCRVFLSDFIVRFSKRSAD